MKSDMNIFKFGSRTVGPSYSGRRTSAIPTRSWWGWSRSVESDGEMFDIGSPGGHLMATVDARLVHDVAESVDYRPAK